MKKQPLNYLMAGLAISLFPAGAFAAETVASRTGISDTFLLTALVSVILLLLLIVHAMGQSIQSIGKIKTAEEKAAEKNAGTIAKTVAVLLMAGTSIGAYAADGASSAPFVMSDALFWSLIVIIVFLAAVIAILFRSLKTMIRYKRGESFVEEEEQSIFDVIGSKFTDNVPIEEEVTVMLDHEYDGIRELDNNLPPWWKYMFYATIIFSFVYIFRYHVSGSGELQTEEYNNEMLAANEAKAVALASGGEQITEDNVTLLVDLDALTTGANIYKGNCATCHGALAEGIVGPNLTDEYYIHGGGIKNVFKMIKYGVPAKGMIAWQSQFSPFQMQQIASYIVSLQGSNPTNPKDPQGDLWVEEDVAPTEAATDSTATEAPAEDITADIAE